MRCKVRLDRKATVEVPWSEEPQVELEFSPVTGGSEENEQFFVSTPAGKITLDVVNPRAVRDLKAGKYYYVDFAEAPE